VIQVYTPYSPHCKLVNPLYEETAALLECNALQTRFADIDCLESAQFCSDISVKAYPTIRHYHGGDGLYHEFVGSKDVAEFVKIILTLQALC
jgi:thiol-disulfide isomerase/thioredoxin